MNERILVVDDEPGVRRVLGRLMSGTGRRVVEAADGGEALRRAGEERPDLILLDLNMPGIDGWQVLRRLRQEPRTRGVPVMLLTGESETAQKVAGLDAGADDYLAKPFSFTELKARAESLLRRSALTRSVSPLTGLPAGPAIAEEVERRLRAGEDFALLYADVDDFKAYNDRYGWEAGDRVIAAAASILAGSLESCCPGRGLAGHIGGDDFVAVLPASAAVPAAWVLTGSFDGCAPSFYALGDRMRGGIEARDRYGERRFHPVMRLSVGAALAPAGRFRSYAEAARAASTAKARAKAGPRGGYSRFAVER